MNAVDPTCPRTQAGYEYAAIASFWANLKTECFSGLIPATRARAHSMLFDSIETFYNPVRKHSALGMLSPAALRKLTLPQLTQPFASTFSNKDHYCITPLPPSPSPALDRRETVC
jgi:hypothetical protein